MGFSLGSPHMDALRALARDSPYAFLASLRMMTSSEYFTPLPLYGSGLRNRTDLGGDFTDALLVGALHQDLGLGRGGHA